LLALLSFSLSFLLTFLLADDAAILEGYGTPLAGSRLAASFALLLVSRCQTGWSNDGP